MMEVREHKLLRVVIIIALIISVISLSISYSAFSSYLEIRLKTAIENRNWLIQLQNASEPIIVGSGEEVTAPTNVSSTITFDVSLKKRGDSVTYTFDMINDGTLDTKLSVAPTFTGVTEAEDKAITYKLTYDDGTEIVANDSLLAGSTNARKMTVSYNSDATFVQSEDTTLTIKATLLYVQQ